MRIAGQHWFFTLYMPGLLERIDFMLVFDVERHSKKVLVGLGSHRSAADAVESHLQH